ncbi:GNAT family N-acetyltransferase [Flavisolibacter ginsenosidimutans]|uniref:GNAT family N-acetyltransferase n=1 Tax=Flavisolibacter ginsenosidimutans TaxID=661481 RepID=A0A5B8UDY0_9BACT|nr:GNAT family N-acetyltransferase [Flavisolibacter ginsenosidimutans]QEC54506.1 GNAT family N-acetyltransferase [Flavisolibacter ginsenosidimutans]
MQFREARADDIAQIQRVRHSVNENVLSDPALVPDSDVLDYITQRGKGWVCEDGERIVGFSIADVKGNNIWALFVEPEFERKGIGKKLHQLMLDWYFSQTDKTVWLSTAPRSRAERFYRKAGWTETGIYGKGEIKFEMAKEQWGNNH